MSTLSCADARISLGAYVLGALDAGERTEVEHHLEGCPACRDELAELAGLPGLLAHVDVDTVVEGEPNAPSELLDRLLTAAAAERRASRRWRVLAAAAALVALVAAGTAVGVSQASGGHHSTRPPTATHVITDPATGVHAQITPVAKGWGTSVRVQLTGVREGETCSLVVVNKNGQRDVAASWKVNYSGAVDVQGATAWPSSDIASYDVVTVDGRRLVSVPA
jgi:anti-sigma factor RsiW